MEEGEEIGMVLARALELKTKLNDCIDRFGTKEEEEGEGEEKEEEESLANIRDAFQALEQQLSGLQALQEQQKYERESSLFQIDRSRKVLVNKLQEYKGDNMEVIHEALTFASETLDHDDGLLLPPYPSDLPDLFVMDDHHPSSRFTSNYKLAFSGVTGEVKHRESMNLSEGKECNQPVDRNKPRGVRLVFGSLAKSVLTFVGVVSVLCLAGFRPSLRKNGMQFKLQDLFLRSASEERQALVECPAGKVLVLEEGRPRCLVKERVEVPFDIDVNAPKIYYGFG